MIGVGGYASFPIITAAILGRYPRLIMEQNSIPGLANRTLGTLGEFCRGYRSAHASLLWIAGGRYRQSGPAGVQVVLQPKTHSAPYTILIFGGSQGAQSINKAVMEALEPLSDWKDRLRFVHQTGERQLEEVKKAYTARGFNADVRTFFNDFHQQYAAADLIIARSGATTVAEIKAAGRAAILIPFPFATDDHQTKNAKAMVDEKAAVLIENAQLSRAETGGHDPRLARQSISVAGTRIKRSQDCGIGC